MIIIKVLDEKTARLSSKAEQQRDPDNKAYQSSQDWNDLAVATNIAERLNTYYKEDGKVFIPTDEGEWNWPRFDVIETPYIGDEVSYRFNDDSYPCGTIVSISPTRKKIKTSSGRIFLRLRTEGRWASGLWVMIIGHRDEQNPSF